MSVQEPSEKELLPAGPLEFRKRKREVFLVFVIGFLFLALTVFEIRLFGISQQLPFEHSVFFFGLVNFNIILLLLLLFLIFRNVVKVFVERRGKVIGSGLKSKLVAAFVTFSFVPTILMFVISVFYINSSFDKWFSVKMAGVLKSSLEVSNAYYFNAKKRNYHFAHQVAEKIKPLLVFKDRRSLPERLKELRKSFNLDAVEYYADLFADPLLVISDEEQIPPLPPLSLEFLKKGIDAKIEASFIHQFGEGNLVRVIIPVDETLDLGAVVVSSYVPLSLITKMNEITSVYEDFRDVNPLEYPLKSIYSIILFLMTLVILLCATWFGFYLAKQLSIPLVLLGRATRRVAAGDFAPVVVQSGSEEIFELVKSFNQMTENLDLSKKQVLDAQKKLQNTLEQLDEHSKYLEVVLSNVSTGVISVNKEGIVTTLNNHAADLLKIPAQKFIGRPVRELMSRDSFRTFRELLKAMQEHNVQSIQKEVKMLIQGENLPLQLYLSILRDEKGREIGKILVFDDLSMIVSAQRAAAWTEVARRIAHEIKNPLTPIKLSAERLQRKFAQFIDDPAFLDCTSMIIKQTEALKELVNEFSHFARMPQAKLVAGDFNATIADALVLYHSAHPDILIRFEPDLHIPVFKFDPEQIKRVLVNLVDNAIGSFTPKSKVVENDGTFLGQVVISSRFDHDLRMVVLSVVDNGAGIPVQDRSRVFEPYFSTKEGGTGLGLPIVKRIIEDHNGFVRALGNEEQEGTKIVIEIPVFEDKSIKPISV